MNDNTFKHGIGGYVNHKCRCDVCRDARRIVSRRYYAANREANIEARRRYYAANREARIAADRRYREANAEAIAKRARRYREAQAAQINGREKFKREKVRQQASRHYETWTEQEDSVVLNFDLTAMEIAFMLKRTHSAVQARRNNLRKLARS